MNEGKSLIEIARRLGGNPNWSEGDGPDPFPVGSFVLVNVCLISDDVPGPAITFAQIEQYSIDKMYFVPLLKNLDWTDLEIDPESDCDLLTRSVVRLFVNEQEAMIMAAKIKLAQQTVMRLIDFSNRSYEALIAEATTDEYNLDNILHIILDAGTNTRDSIDKSATLIKMFSKVEAE